MSQPLTIGRTDLEVSGDMFSVHQSAFGAVQGQEIVDLVKAMFNDPTAQPILSLVASSNEEILGHVLFTKAEISGDGKSPCARLMAPLSVRKEHQRTGIGSALVNEGLRQLGGDRVDLVFVLGNPAYYGRFGFTAAMPKGFVPPHALPNAYKDAWMVTELAPETLVGGHGRVRCPDSISDPRHWRE